MGERAAAFPTALLTRLLPASPTCSVVSISGVSRNALCLPGAAPRLAQQRRSQPLSLAAGGGTARPRPVRCAAGSRGVPRLAYGSAAAARLAAWAPRSPAAASGPAFTSVALRDGGTLCYRPLPASMGAAPSSMAAGPSRRPAYGSGSSLTRSRRMVLLSAAAPEATAPPAHDAAGVSVEFDNDSGEARCCTLKRSCRMTQRTQVRYGRDCTGGLRSYVHAACCGAVNLVCWPVPSRPADPQCTVMQLFGRNDTEVLAQVGAAVWLKLAQGNSWSGQAVLAGTPPYRSLCAAPPDCCCAAAVLVLCGQGSLVARFTSESMLQLPACHWNS